MSFINFAFAVCACELTLFLHVQSSYYMIPSSKSYSFNGRYTYPDSMIYCKFCETN